MRTRITSFVQHEIANEDMHEHILPIHVAKRATIGKNLCHLVPLPVASFVAELNALNLILRGSFYISNFRHT